VARAALALAPAAPASTRFEEDEAAARLAVPFGAALQAASAASTHRKGAVRLALLLTLTPAYGIAIAASAGRRRSATLRRPHARM
jgi:hypothetical protein